MMKQAQERRAGSVEQMQKMQMIALDLVKFYLGRLWQFQWSFSMKPAGRCWNHRGLIEVGIREAVVLGMDEFVETILHEIAHAITKEAHTEAWRRCYIAIGGNGTVTTDESILWEAKHRRRLLIERGLNIDILHRKEDIDSYQEMVLALKRKNHQ